MCTNIMAECGRDAQCGQCIYARKNTFAHRCEGDARMCVGMRSRVCESVCGPVRGEPIGGGGFLFLRMCAEV